MKADREEQHKIEYDEGIEDEEEEGRSIIKRW
jgi:hypothetical protein